MGENGIRRDTQYGKGVLKGAWNGAAYDWTLLGQEHFTLGAVSKLVLDPRTPDNAAKTVFVALSSEATANAIQSTVYTRPPDSYGIWRSRNAGSTWTNVLATANQASDLEMDPQAPDVMWAGVRRQGLYKTTDGGNTWQPSHTGIPAQVLASADWPEIQVFRKPGMTQAILYAVFGECPHPHEKQPINRVSCEPIIYRSNGTAVELCSHTQAYAAGETDETVFNRAANAINAGGPCQRAGVRAAIAGRAEAGDLEDQEPEPFRIQLEAPAQAGTQLITEVSASGAGFFTVHGFGTPERGRMTSSRVAFSGTAAGGRVEVTEQSLVGSCTFAVETTAGESAEAVAERLQAAFLAPEAAGRPAVQFAAACLPGQNPRDAKRSGAALRFLLGSEISVNSPTLDWDSRSEADSSEPPRGGPAQAGPPCSQPSKTATARTGEPVPPRILSGRPIKRNRPRPTS